MPITSVQSIAAAAFMHALEPYARPEPESSIEKIRDGIQQYGESVMDWKQVRLLCRDVPAKREWDAIAGIAIKEGWSFTFLPDGSIRFARL